MIPFHHQGIQRKGRDSNPHVLSDTTLAGQSRHQFHAPFRIGLLRLNDRRRDKWNRGELNPVAVFARHSSDPSAIPLSDSDLGGNRTHTPRGSRLSTDPVYQLQHEIISAAHGGTHSPE